MALLGVCNPLLDVVAEVPLALLNEYGLPHGGAVLANKEQMALFPRLEKEFSCKYMAGGCGQNTVRVYQALCNKASWHVSFRDGFAATLSLRQLRGKLSTSPASTVQ